MEYTAVIITVDDGNQFPNEVYIFPNTKKGNRKAKEFFVHTLTKSIILSEHVSEKEAEQIALDVCEHDSPSYGDDDWYIVWMKDNVEFGC